MLKEKNASILLYLILIIALAAVVGVAPSVLLRHGKLPVPTVTPFTPTATLTVTSAKVQGWSRVQECGLSSPIEVRAGTRVLVTASEPEDDRGNGLLALYNEQGALLAWGTCR